MQTLSRLIFRIVGWHTEGSPPASPRAVVIGAPHTSNWDGVILLLAAWSFGIRLSWFLKASWFVFPLSSLLRAVGAVPIERSARHGVVAWAIEQMKTRESMLLTVPPEGTRSWAPHWKSGFYHIALGAGVPIAFGFIDYKRKAAGFGPTLVPTGDLAADFAAFRAFYAGVTPRFPAQAGPVVPAPPSG